MKTLLTNLEEAKGDAESLVKKLADAQGRMADAIDKAADVVSAQWDAINSASEQLTVQLKAPKVDGATVAELFKKYQVDAGDGLSSRLVDLIEARGGKVYPETYPVRRSRWALVER
jgi:LysM repeat protein